MKKMINTTKIFLLFSWLLFGLLSSCNKDFLDREPLSQLSPNNSFNSASELQLYTNSFYNDLIPSGTSLYNQTIDNVITNTVSSTITGDRTVPVSGGGWGWSDLRNINFFLQNYTKGNLPDNISAPYVGVAKFFRAYFYFNMVQTFGDVPWYSGAINANDSALLNKPRDSRILVVDSILADHVA